MESKMRFAPRLFFIALILLSQSLWAGPEIQTWETTNGARVWFVAAPDLPIVDARVVFDAGSARDAKQPGLARLTNGVMTDGAGQWNADQIAERLESVGAELGNGAARDMAWVSMRSLKQKRALDTAVETLAGPDDDIVGALEALADALGTGPYAAPPAPERATVPSGPRYSVGARYLGSQVSWWAAPPGRKIWMTDLATPSRVS